MHGSGGSRTDALQRSAQNSTKTQELLQLTELSILAFTSVPGQVVLFKLCLKVSQVPA